MNTRTGSCSRYRITAYCLLVFGVYGILLLATFVFPSAAFLRVAVAVPFLLIYVFHNAGVPGLLENNGLCGWGWCSPTIFGWFFLVSFWLLLVWAAVWLLIRCTGRSSQ